MTHLSWGVVFLALTLGQGEGVPPAPTSSAQPTPIMRCCCDGPVAQAVADCCEQVCRPPNKASAEIAALLAKYSILFKEGQYAEAEQVADRARELDPDDPMAAAAATTARALRRIKEFKLSTALEATQCRDNLVNAKASPPKEREIVERLGKPISCDFKNAPLGEVIDELRCTLGVNLVVDKRALDEEGISLDRPVTLQLEDVSAKAALQTLLRQAGLTCVVKDEVLQITTEARARGKLLTRTYPVEGVRGQWQYVRRERDGTDRVIRLITSAVDPATWSEVGGPGTIQYFAVGRALVVKQTADDHEAIEELLTRLRALQGRHFDRPCCGPMAVPFACGPAFVPPPAMALAPPCVAPMMPACPVPPPTYCPTPPATYYPPPSDVIYRPTVGEPTPPPPPPMPPCPYEATGRMQERPPMQATPPCTPIPPPGCYSEGHVQVLRIAVEAGQGRLELGTGDTTVTCADLAMKMPGGPVKVTVANNQLQVNAAGLRASADHVTRGPNDRLILEGHVKLRRYANGQQIAVTAERAVIGLATGYLEVQGTPQTPPATPVRTESSTGSAPQECFSFWLGLAR